MQAAVRRAEDAALRFPARAKVRARTTRERKYVLRRARHRVRVGVRSGSELGCIWAAVST